jgi:hypothetical protein
LKNAFRFQIKRHQSLAPNSRRSERHRYASTLIPVQWQVVGNIAARFILWITACLSELGFRWYGEELVDCDCHPVEMRSDSARWQRLDRIR